MSTATEHRPDVYTRIRDQILEQLERGVRPWLQPWNSSVSGAPICRPVRASGDSYTGVNVLVLYMAADLHGYNLPTWMTYKQARAMGAFVRRGERGTRVTYVGRYTKTEINDDGDEIECEIPFLREYTVFNACQINGLPVRFYLREKTPKALPARIAAADRFFANTRAVIRNGGDIAYYSIKHDYIQMPPFQAFPDGESYSATLAHELTHWTRHPERLNRDFGRKRWGDAGYAMEELVAELGASFLCVDLQITPELREDHASYIDSWIDVLSRDKRAIFTAASHASNAVNYLHSLQPEPSLPSPLASGA
jgi:antirestriction protein ArdC